MDKGAVITFNVNALLVYLFCGYALALSFELFFEIMLGIETIFKPFRIFALAILGTYGVKVFRQGFSIDAREKIDVFFYMMFVTGVVVSYIRIITGPFNLSLFYNDLFLVGLNVLVFFVFKNTDLSSKDLLKILYCFIAGVIVNAAYVFYTFSFQGIISRQSGFYDNPNYTALATSMAITFLTLYSNYLHKVWKQVSIIVIIFLLGYVFMVSGSRTGLVILVISLFLVFIFSSLLRKIAAFLLILGFMIFLLPRNLEQATIGGPLVLVKRINSKMNQDDVDVRFVIWDGVFRMLESEGYLGMGLGQYKEKFTLYFSNESHLYVLNMVERGYFLSTHNDFLSILTDYGLVALLFYLLFISFSFLKLLQNVLYPDEEEGEVHFLTRYKFLILVSLIIFGLASENLPNPLFWFLMMVATKHIDEYE